MLEEWGGSILSPSTPKRFRKRADPAGTLFFCSGRGEVETGCGYEGRLGAGCAPFFVRNGEDQPPDRGCEGCLGAGCAPFLFGKGRVSTRTVVVKGALARGALLFFRNGSDRTSGCGCEGCLDAGCVPLARQGNGIFFDRAPCLPPPFGQRMMTALMNRMPERRLSSSLRASRW